MRRRGWLQNCAASNHTIFGSQVQNLRPLEAWLEPESRDLVVNFLCTTISLSSSKAPSLHELIYDTQCSFCALLVYYFLNARMRYSIQSDNISCQNFWFGFTYIRIILAVSECEVSHNYGSVRVRRYSRIIRNHAVLFLLCVNINILDRGKCSVYDQTLTQKAL